MKDLDTLDLINLTLLGMNIGAISCAVLQYVGWIS